MEYLKKIIIRQDLKGNVVLFIISFLMSFVALYFIFGDHVGGSLEKYLGSLIIPVGIILYALFGAIAGYSAYRFLTNKPILEFNQYGFYDKSTKASLGYVSWNEVVDINFCRIYNQEFIGVRVKDVEKLFVGKSSYVIDIARANVLCGNPPIAIRLGDANKSMEEVIDLMNLYWKNANNA